MPVITHPTTPPEALARSPTCRKVWEKCPCRLGPELARCTGRTQKKPSLGHPLISGLSVKSPRSATPRNPRSPQSAPVHHFASARRHPNVDGAVAAPDILPWPHRPSLPPRPEWPPNGGQLVPIREECRPGAPAVPPSGPPNLTTFAGSPFVRRGPANEPTTNCYLQ